MATLISLPDLPWQEWTFQLVRSLDVARMEGRYTESAEFGEAYWRIVQAQTPFLEGEDIDLAEAFLDAAGQAGVYFAAHDAYRPRPRAYGQQPLSGTRAGGGAFDGSCTLDSIDSSTQLTLSGLPSGFEINQSCLVEVRKSALSRSLHRVMGSATASAGGSVIVQIQPLLNQTVFSTADAVWFEKPSAVFMLENAEAVRKAWSARTLSFTAVEVFPHEP